MKNLSMFSGCGVLDIGIESAGFENVANIELCILQLRRKQE
jgi:site-specific DNA-cytosine methylase